MGNIEEIKSAFAMRLKELIRRKGITQLELAQHLGVSTSTVSAWCTGEKFPRMDKVDTMATYFGVSRSQITGDASLLPTNISLMPSTHKIPLLGTIACGEPITAVENVDSYIDVPDCVTADFALTCKGDSMIDARIFDGDIVYIKEQPEVENGEIAAVLIDDEATLKRVYYQRNKIILKPENKDYEPLVFVGEEILDVRILGKAVYFLSKVR